MDRLKEDLPEDELSTDDMDIEDASLMTQQALALEEQQSIDGLIDDIRKLPTDTKTLVLMDVIGALQTDGYRQIMIFTQYTDTLDYLRQEVVARYGNRSVICFSGRGGELMDGAGAWKTITREETKTLFKNRMAEIMLCTDAAAEGLNFQFCGALVNYDMPWNPMKVEQRIGRIDRLGQEFDRIRIVNLHYNDTVETDIYRALRERINLFQTFIGRLQPILARLPGMISDITLSSPEAREISRSNLISTMSTEMADLETRGFNLDDVTEDELIEPDRPAALLDLKDLGKVIANQSLRPPDVEVAPIGPRDFSYLAPGMNRAIRVTTDPEYFDDHPESTELWSPGAPVFPFQPPDGDMAFDRSSTFDLQAIIRKK
ncbi:MAG: helicase-related protein [Desulfatirhabdiaceae bacterium]